MSQGSVKHLLIDLDGTLVDFREIAAQADFVMKTLRSFRREFSSLGWVAFLRAMRDVKNELRRPSTYSPWPEATNFERASIVFSSALGLPIEEGSSVLDRTMHRVFPTLERHFFPIPGAREFIDWAHGRLPITLATNPVWPVELVRQRVRWGGIDPERFALITHAGVMHACKPSRHYYHETVRISAGERGLKPGDFLHVGNEWVNDLAATRIGVPVFIVGRDAKFRKIQIAKGELASAWTGTYLDLQSFLDGQI